MPRPGRSRSTRSRTATPLSAAVRAAVIASPSMIATGAPVVGSSSTMSDASAGSPRARLPVPPPIHFMPSRSADAPPPATSAARRRAGIAPAKTPSGPGATAERSGISAPPHERSQGKGGQVDERSSGDGSARRTAAPIEVADRAERLGHAPRRSAASRCSSSSGSTTCGWLMFARCAEPSTMVPLDRGRRGRLARERLERRVVERAGHDERRHRAVGVDPEVPVGRRRPALDALERRLGQDRGRLEGREEDLACGRTGHRVGERRSVEERLQPLAPVRLEVHAARP